MSLHRPPSTPPGIREVVRGFRDAAVRAAGAGFRVAEIHAAHGYLLHEFLSPLTNTRTDEYGGSFENRARLLLEVVDVIRTVWSDELPLWVRISATDWAEGGWDIDQSVELSAVLATRGVDLIDVSSGGAVRHQQVVAVPGYQVPFAERIRREAGIATGAVGSHHRAGTGRRDHRHRPGGRGAARTGAAA